MRRCRCAYTPIGNQTIQCRRSITIEEDGRFQFSFSVISSYIGTGTYVQDGDLLVLHTDDGKYHYAFQLADDGLVFDADSSSDFLGHADIPDGAVFQ